MRTPSILYLTVDGILGHIGFSQIVRVVERLHSPGLRYAIASLERAGDLADGARVERVRARLEGLGIRWVHRPYRQGGARDVVLNLIDLERLALREVRRHTHVHARGYHAGAIAMTLGRPWLFDARGYWVDERLEEKRWFTTKPRLALARAWERRMFLGAGRVVTLTQLQADDATAMRAPSGGAPALAIPTCADYGDFHPRDPATARSGPVIGIVGSINRSYLVEETAKLASMILARSRDARVRVVSGEHQRWRELLEQAGAPGDRIDALRAPHERMPEELRSMSWAILLLTPETRAKRGSMPTKLAECFASGVRVCAYGCNSEMEDWVRRAGGGWVLPGVTPHELEAAADHVASAVDEPNLAAREATRAHFALDGGIARYRRLLTEWAG